MKPLIRRHLRTTLRLLFLFFAVLCIATPASAQETTEATLARSISNEIRNHFSTDESLNSALTKSYGSVLDRDRASIAKASLRRILFHDALPNYIAKLIMPVYKSDMTKLQLDTVIVEGIASLQAKGLARLTVDRQQQFVAHILAMMAWLPARDCKAMVLGHMDTATSAAIERHYLASLPRERFQAATLLYQEASEAELSGTPSPRTLNLNQSRLAEQAHELAFIKRLKGLNNPGLIRRVTAGPETSEPSESCLFYRQSFLAMLDLGTPYSAWQMTKFIQSMQ